MKYRTNDVIIECEKVNPQNIISSEHITTMPSTPSSNPSATSTNKANNNDNTVQPTVTTQTAVIQPEMANSSTNNSNHSNNNFQNIIKPFKRESSYMDSSSLQDMIDELPTDVDYEVETKKPKLLETTVELRETRLGVQLVSRF